MPDFWQLSLPPAGHSTIVPNIDSSYSHYNLGKTIENCQGETAISSQLGSLCQFHPSRPLGHSEDLSSSEHGL